MEIAESKLKSPVGELRLAATDAGLCRVGFPGTVENFRRELAHRFGEIRMIDGAARRSILERASRMLERYFSGRREDFAALPLDPGGTEFQREVWNSLRAIPSGETRSYGQIAAAIGRPSAVRAVGSANRMNPLAIVVPCHRVIGSDGALRGYAGRLDRKDWLLRHEGAIVPAVQETLPLGAISGR